MNIKHALLSLAVYLVLNFILVPLALFRWFLPRILPRRRAA